VTTKVSNALELAFIITLFLRTWLRHKSLGGQFSNTGWNLFLSVALMLSLADCVVGIFNVKGIIPGNFRLARLCRPLVFMACYKNLRQAVTRILTSIPKFASVIASLVICVLLFTWVGVILFARSCALGVQCVDEGSKHFNTWGESIASMWVLFTTANNPDVWLPAYKASRWSFVFFGTYLLLTLYVINNVLLAAVYDAYKDELTQSVKLFYKNRKAAIEHAFNLLAEDIAGERAIGVQRWGIFFACYCDSRYGGVGVASHQENNIAKGQLAFRALDDDGSGGLSLKEFRLIVDVFQENDHLHRKIPAIKNPILRRIRHGMAHHFHVHGFAFSWDTAVDVLIFIDIGMVFVCTMIFMSSNNIDVAFEKSVWRYDSPWFWAAFAFSCFYFIETTFKLWLLGVERFCSLRPFVNPFDFLNVYTLMTLEVVYIFWQGTGTPPSGIVRLYVLCRIARVIRLLWHIRPLRQISRVMLKLAPTYRRLAFMLLILFYVYATVGEQIFGGLIRQKSEYKLKGTDFAADQYWDLNFNDFSSGMVTLFILLIVNNWFVVANAFLILTDSNWSVIFFVSFFLIANLIVLNILMALILDCFASIRDEMEHQEEREAQRQRLNSEGSESSDSEGDGAPVTAAQRRAQMGHADHFKRESILRKLLGVLQDEDELIPSARVPALPSLSSPGVSMNHTQSLPADRPSHSQSAPALGRARVREIPC